MKGLIDYAEYKRKILTLNDDYWLNSMEERWQYIAPVINEIKLMNSDAMIRTALEIGTNKISLLSFSDCLDRSEKYIDPDNTNNRVFIKDARLTPWSMISDKYYDIFVALQVLEHLGPNQLNVFREIKRVSKNAFSRCPICGIPILLMKCTIWLMMKKFLIGRMTQLHTKGKCLVRTSISNG